MNPSQMKIPMVEFGEVKFVVLNGQRPVYDGFKK